MSLTGGFYPSQIIQTNYAEQQAQLQNYMLGQLGYAQQAYNGIGNVLGGNMLSGNGLMDQFQKAMQTNPNPAPKVNKKAENEEWLDSKITEISYAL